ncbi:MAG TPA: DUF2867 domain-containing protein, partial [Lysobacter sp.]|nr:DUF2867 domain-containing protein [Lysobacter sp.]
MLLNSPQNDNGIMIMTAQHVVRSIALPPQSCVNGIYAQTNLVDAYSIELPSHASKNPEALARFIFSNLPRWMIYLMRLRDLLVAAFGLKTARHLNSVTAETETDRVGIFRIYSRERDELIFGEDDKHLDFRLSLLCAQAPSTSGERQLVLSTVVHCHNRWGRLYICLI